MASAQTLAADLLAERGLTGSLTSVGGIWQLRATRGTEGAAVEIEGDPGEEILTEAVDLIAGALGEIQQAEK